MMLLVDSSGWIEFFTDSPKAIKYSKHLKDLNRIITPTIILYEVYKKIKMERSEEDALIAIALINRTNIIPLNESIALLAADISLTHSLPMADAIVYATALEKNCKIVTSDTHFKGLDSVLIVI